MEPMTARGEAKDEKTRLTMLLPDAEARLQEQINEGEVLCKRIERGSDTDLEQFRIDVRTWSSYTTDLLSSMFTDSRFTNEFGSDSSVLRRSSLTLPEVWAADKSKLRQKVARLISIKQRLRFVPIEPPINAESKNSNRIAAAESRAVFVVHGHDDGAKNAVARLIDQLHFNPVILHEQSNRGQTVIEKFERHSDVAFAVVLLTDDDMGAAKPAAANLKPRARQNVVLELGYFIGRLGRENVAVLSVPGLELPSDLAGVIPIEYDKRGAWKSELASEMKAAGLAVDMNDLHRTSDATS